MKLWQVVQGQVLNFTGMGGPMGVYDNYDSVNGEGNYGDPNATTGLEVCPPAFDCNGIPPSHWHPTDGVDDGFW
jgi:hypothetical protein